MTNPVTVVQQWQDAINQQDVERLLELSAPDIEIVGPRGSGHGHQLLRDWLARAGLRLTTLRTFSRGDAVVLFQHGVWHAADTQQVIGEVDVASRFRVQDAKVIQFARYDNLGEALAAAGLSEDDEVAF